jgi:hypothetical protein
LQLRSKCSSIFVYFLCVMQLKVSSCSLCALYGLFLLPMCIVNLLLLPVCILKVPLAPCVYFKVSSCSLCVLFSLLLLPVCIIPPWLPMCILKSPLAPCVYHKSLLTRALRQGLFLLLLYTNEYFLALCLLYTNKSLIAPWVHQQVSYCPLFVH